MAIAVHLLALSQHCWVKTQPVYHEATAGPILYLQLGVPLATHLAPIGNSYRIYRHAQQGNSMSSTSLKFNGMQ